MVGFVFQTILCSAYGDLIDLLYTDNLYDWVRIVKVVFECYPPFAMSKAYYDISARTSKQISISDGVVRQGS